MRKTRALMREMLYACGQYLDVDIYEVFKKAGGRQKRGKPTSETQERLNQKNAERALARLVNMNFTAEDIEIHLTYAGEHLPANCEEAKKECDRFIRRLRALRRDRGLPEMRYIIIDGGGENPGEGRFHHHITLSGGIDRTELERLWGNGWANAKALQFGPEGVDGLSKYMGRQRSGFRKKNTKRYRCSKNLKRPVAVPKDGRVSKKRWFEIAELKEDCRAELEKLYPGYKLAKVESFRNEVNKSVYLHIRMYRDDAVFFRDQWKKKRKRGRE